MAILLNFWHDGANFEFAYALYQDEELTIPAVDGYYSANGYVRQQLGGKLQTLITC
tara:strand:+ start:5944 stop:6111 length:168 start_codon:yes stop_codon:yes gene_type:complete